MSQAKPDETRALLAKILDEIVPPSTDGSLPGAGELGLADWVEQALERQPGLGGLLAQGLSRVSRLAESRHPAGFAALPRTDRVALLREVEAAEPAFFGALVVHTYLGFYSHPQVTDRLGVQSPPQPKGHDLEPGDLSLLEPVRRRSRLYRTC